ncbi:MAG: hypothetical protein HKM26_01055 [Winogradskyella sp.]|nr:hypothetical protein [Winogradskyella sp.]
MNYKDVFKFSNVEKGNNEYSLKDYDYVIDKYSNKNFKFEEDFYLRVFLKKLLFDTDIVELEDFLEFQFNSSNSPIIYLKLLDRKIVPKTKEIIKKAQFSPAEVGYFNETKLIDGFIETEGVIKKWEYDYAFFLHSVYVRNLKEDLEKRIEIVEEFIKKFGSGMINENLLTWKGKPSHLAYFISQFIEEGYIEAPKKDNGDINLQSLSNMLFNSFNFPMRPSAETFIKYGNIDNQNKYYKLNKRFNDNGFHIPNRKIME